MTKKNQPTLLEYLNKNSKDAQIMHFKSNISLKNKPKPLFTLLGALENGNDEKAKDVLPSCYHESIPNSDISLENFDGYYESLDATALLVLFKRYDLINYIKNHQDKNVSRLFNKMFEQDRNNNKLNGLHIAVLLDDVKMFKIISGDNPFEQLILGSARTMSSKYTYPVSPSIFNYCLEHAHINNKNLRFISHENKTYLAQNLCPESLDELKKYPKAALSLIHGVEAKILLDQSLENTQSGNLFMQKVLEGCHNKNIEFTLSKPLWWLTYEKNSHKNTRSLMELTKIPELLLEAKEYFKKTAAPPDVFLNSEKREFMSNLGFDFGHSGNNNICTHLLKDFVNEKNFRNFKEQVKFIIEKTPHLLNLPSESNEKVSNIEAILIKSKKVLEKMQKPNEQFLAYIESHYLKFINENTSRLSMKTL